MKRIIILIIIFATVILLIPVASAQTLNCNNLIAKESRGTRVKLLQSRLNKIMNCNLDLDGYVGPLTESCIIEFQQRYNLDVDGIAGPQTCRKLNELYYQEINKKYIVILDNKVNIRNGASLTQESILTTVNQGKILRTYGTKTVDGIKWYIIHIKQNNKIINGYIQSDYAKTTAIVLNITNQKLTYYRNGKVFMNVPVITGKNKLHDTPIGKYIIDPINKSQAQILTGYNDDGIFYETYVNYWIPLTENNKIGFHDAYWRREDEYNKSTYLNDGSYGTINMKSEDVKKLYENLKAKTYVFITK